jgi:hypothetical protein
MPITRDDPGLVNLFNGLAGVCSVNLHGYRDGEWDVSVQNRSGQGEFQCTGTDMLDVATKALNEAEARGWVVVKPTLPLQVQRPQQA